MADRKARLAELRKLKETAEDPKANNVQNVAKDEDKKISFRNYDPLTEHVKSLKDSKEGAAPAAAPAKTLETEMKQIEKDAKELLEKQVTTSETVEIASLAPRKPGFDLARDLERRMEKLEKRTNYAIAENIRKRFKDSHDISEVADVNQDQEDLDEDDD
ncbi:Coiled-coil domain-containing protein 12 [Rhizoclosmatium hyalinum]|nr:Coiled-coil domain-containing protein 12 [Rhizoclosmatium hyalinum]